MSLINQIGKRISFVVERGDNARLYRGMCPKHGDITISSEDTSCPQCSRDLKGMQATSLDPTHAQATSIDPNRNDIIGGLKFDSEKPRMELLDAYALEQIALVMGLGAKKYADENWRGGFKWKRLLGAAMRHLIAFMGGQDKDPETGLSHIAHLGCCAMFLLWHEKNKPDLDDRYKEVRK